MKGELRLRPIAQSQYPVQTKPPEREIELNHVLLL